VKFEEKVPLKTEPSGILKLNFTPSDTHNDLTYYTHFTLSKIENNTPQLLTYSEEATCSNTFKDGVELEPGAYILTTGNRLSDGSVLASLTTFEIKSDKETAVELSLRENSSEIKVLGRITNPSFVDLASGKDSLIASEGFTVVGIIAPNHEPTNHALNDIVGHIKEMESMGCKIAILDISSKAFISYSHVNDFKTASNVRWLLSTSEDDTILSSIAQQLNIDATTLPIFLLCDKEGNVYFIKQGYTIHMGEQILKVLKELRTQEKI
jgi:hypothetical protein